MHKELIGNTEFSFSKADSPELLSEIFKLRYKVYCEECRFLKPEDYPLRIEQDQYDAHSLQFAIEDAKGLVGTARLILNSNLGFPLEEHYRGRLNIDTAKLPRNRLAEVSRLVISKEYRKRAADGLYYSPDFQEKPPLPQAQGPAQRMRPMAFGLYREMYQDCKRLGINYWFACMEESLWKLLCFHGFTFHPIGDEIDYYGPVKPYLAKLNEIENSVSRKFPDFFQKYFLEGLESEFWPKHEVELAASDLIPGVFNAFAGVAKLNPEKAAAAYKREEVFEEFTFSDLYLSSLKFGNYLHSIGIRPRDRVVIYLENSPQWLQAFLALQYNQCAVVPIDPALTQEELYQRLRLCYPRLVICQEKNLSNLLELASQGQKVAENLVIDSFQAQAQIQKMLAQDILGLSYPDADDTALLFYTSGTTATSQTIPKLVMLSQQNIISNFNSIVNTGLCRADDVFISMLPFYHPYPFMVNCVLPLLAGAKVSFPSSMNLDSIIECIAATRVTIFTAVPQIFALLHRQVKDRLSRMVFISRGFIKLAEEVCWLVRSLFGLNPAKRIFAKIHRIFGSSLRFMVSGGASLESYIVKDFYKWGFTLLEGYGLTEASPVVSWNTPQSCKIGSVGKPIPHVDVVILNPDKKGVGEIAVKGLNIMAGYFQSPVDSSKVVQNGWLLTGDAGCIDRDGFLFVLGRRDETIVLDSGKKVSPEEIEKHYQTSRLIKEACVFLSLKKGIFETSKQLAAVIVPSENARSDVAIKKELEALSQGLSEHKRVHGFLLSNSSLPRTALGKLKRKLVAERFARECKSPSYPAKQQGKAGLEPEEEAGDAASRTVIEYLSMRLGRAVRLDDNLELDLGLDSLGKLELLFEIQKLLKISVPESATTNIFYSRTVRELLFKIKPFASG